MSGVSCESVEISKRRIEVIHNGVTRQINWGVDSGETGDEGEKIVEAERDGSQTNWW